MNRKLEDLIDIPLLQSLQDKLNAIYSFPSAIIDNEGKILTAVAWQDICTKFHRIHPESEKECIKSDKYILEHLHQAKPAVSYQCPHGLVDNATPIIIDGLHLGNFFTGQFFLEKPDLEFFRKQAKVYGFDEKAYLAAVKKVPVWSKKKLNMYLDFIKGFIEIIAGIGLKNLKEIEFNNQLSQANIELEVANRKLLDEITERELAQDEQHKSDELFRTVFELSTVGKSLTAPDGRLLRINKTFADMLGYPLDEMMNINFADITHPDDLPESRECVRSLIAKEKNTWRFEKRYFHKNGSVVWADVSTTLLHDDSGSPLYLITSIQDISERKKAEEKLFALSVRQEALLSAVPDIIMEVDKNKIYTWANKSGMDFFGDDVVGREAAFYFEGEQETYNIVKPLFNGDDKIFYLESWQRRKDGEKRLLGWWCRVLKDEYGNVTGALSSAQDITDQKRAEAALHENEEIFNHFMQYSPIYIFFKDHKIRSLRLSSNYEKMLGRSLNELLGKTMDDLFPSDLAKKMIENDLHILREGKEISIEEELNGRHYTTIKFPIFIEGKPRYLAGYTIDITEQKLAEESLRKSEFRYRTLFNEAPFIVWEEDFSETKQYLEELRQKGISDFEAYFKKYPEELTHCLNKMKLLDVNKTALFFYGASSFEHLKNNLTQTFTEESFNAFRRAIINLAENRVLFEEEITQRTFSGEIRNVFMRIFLPESEANTFSRVIVVMIDITDRMKAQQEIKKANEDLAKMIAQKDKFFSIIAHDLKSPFQGFLGLTEIMAADASSFTIKELNEFSHRINQSASVLYELLLNLLEWAQMQKGAVPFTPQQLDLLEIASRTLDALRFAAAQKEITLELNISESLKIYADEKMIDSVIRNLLSNAIKFTPRGGGVLLSAQEIDSSKVEILIRDTGVGMSQEYSKKLFKIDERVGSEGTEDEPSTGLGLLLCKEFVEKNGGTIWVETEEGKGSAFHFTIPSSRTN